MKKLFVIALALFLNCNIDCDTSLKNAEITSNDENRYLGNGIYLKRIIVKTNGNYPDRIYVLVDSTNKLICSGLTINTTETSGKFSYTKTKTIFK